MPQPGKNHSDNKSKLKNKEKQMAKTIIIVLSVIVVLAGVMSYFMFFGMSDIKKYTISNINVSGIPDGEYTGVHKKGRWNCEVKVTVHGGKITEVDMVSPLKPDDPDDSINEKLKNTLLENQNLQFEAVSGASIHTKAFLKAVENALQ